MNATELETMAQMESEYWWHIGRRDLVRSLLSKFVHRNDADILDYGCGTGGNVDVLAEFGAVDGMDTSPEAVTFCKDKAYNEVRHIDGVPAIEKKYDIIVALDVLEHVREDVQLLEQLRNALTDDGILLLSVPAYRFLWSEHDEALHHLRRYVASDLRCRLTIASLETIRVSYAVSFVFPAILAYRLFRGLFPKDPHLPKTSYVKVPYLVNSFFTFLLKLEAWIMTWMNIPFGCSIFAVARKGQDDPESA